MDAEQTRKVIMSIKNLLQVIMADLMNPNNNHDPDDLEDKLLVIRRGVRTVYTDMIEIIMAAEKASPESNHPEWDSHSDPLITCQHCHAEGRMYVPLNEERSIVQIKKLNQYDRLIWELHDIIILPRLTHYFLGGQGNRMQFDLRSSFLNQEQAEQLPEYICEECLLNLLSGQMINTIDNDRKRIEIKVP